MNCAGREFCQVLDRWGSARLLQRLDLAVDLLLTASEFWLLDGAPMRRLTPATARDLLTWAAEQAQHQPR